MFVFVEDAAQALVFLYVQVSDLARIGDRRGLFRSRDRNNHYRPRN
jgi:hypothetical protein